jgi:peptide/nickel transport system ATP-binding protein
MAERLLEVKGLKTHFFTDEGVVRAVDGVDFYINKGETLGVVGESGCGKSVTALSIMRLIATPPGRIVEGQILYDGRNLLDLTPAQMRKIRGKEISMIFQEPMTSLNPVFTVGEQIAEALRLHEGLNRRDAMDKTVEMLKLVHIPNAERRVKEYPHQLSGGMRQRIMIAMALSCNPKLLIADEPTTALDVTIQAQILDLVKRLQKELGMGVVMITHDLGVVAESCDRVIVMYAGRKVEEADVLDLFDRPLHPYTRALMASMPSMNSSGARLAEIPGMVPAPDELGRGCAFAARCPHANARCTAETPSLVEQDAGHAVACFAIQEGRVEWAQEVAA